MRKLRDILQLKSIIDVARGFEAADLVIKGGKIVNVFTGEIIKTDIAVKGDTIAGIGDYSRAKEVVDVTGKYIIPGLIDAHIHIESSMLTPPGFAAAVLPHGTTTVVADPHEIVNVAGVDGFKYMVETSKGLPLDILYTIPSCVPATDMETSGARIGFKEVEQILKTYPDSPALGEMMNFPGTINKDESVLSKILTATEMGKVVDGHSPGLSGKQLNAYLAVGVSSEHECTTYEEAKEKLGLGMHIFIREGSAARNLDTLLPLINKDTYPYLSFACDDRHPEDLIKHGEIDNILRRAVSQGINPIYAVRMATINTAYFYGLRDRGAIAPGYRADVVAVDNLQEFKIDKVFHKGNKVVDNGQLTTTIKKPKTTRELFRTVHLPPIMAGLAPDIQEDADVRVIEVIPNQIVTRQLLVDSKNALPEMDVLPVAVIERYGKNGNIGKGLVKGFGLKKGALASTVAHDSHNLIVVGTNEVDMKKAAEEVAAMGGGLVATANGKVLASLALTVGGLMSEKSAQEVSGALNKLQKACKELGCKLPAPFMTMSFLALPVIPELKITDMGLIDVKQFKIVDITASETNGRP